MAHIRQKSRPGFRCIIGNLQCRRQRFRAFHDAAFQIGILSCQLMFGRFDPLSRQLVIFSSFDPVILQRVNYDSHELFEGRFDAAAF